VKHPRFALIIGTIATSFAVGGCGVHALSASANHAAPTPSPEICSLIDFTKIRAKAAKQPKIDLKDAPSNVRDTPDLIDPRSFVAVASAGDLTDAGINTSGTPQNQLEVVIVNHGHWLSNELPISGAPRGYPAGTTPGPEPTPYVISWQVSVWDVRTYRPRMGFTVPIIRVSTADEPRHWAGVLRVQPTERLLITRGSRVSRGLRHARICPLR
jgi:hypothetical protein